ncbi:FAD binding domain of DNA photolyase [Gemmata obscuriglobus]|uniref:Deoxyribodipyrimidine photo-lyase n=1 Tax=Gemmata obscuriglobus TaxID=114 RepID=A0A2Z3H557_9BACT|nr:deoxyribodipyrimidine photo-lyase [Gemmata obscuriglobus]AWM39462.1 deoxyribodipyrimidine photolyase [Gemmata obscuriglobus]QEG27453.1 FAD binding domain of DNA photolyase [Gemmata obscuriglobus]VTS04425.1 deoxyribodipyrimidine photo-lyase : Putative deoxyribodipyrimidine photo-lyase OS=Leptospira wolbachii serovar Codice str. CDC GN=LEP1GSC195_0155 PE=4 SV=1: FAD_binding_7 [Gemmata obscuriglobus UQM 2246]
MTDDRIRFANAARPNPNGRYVLYWPQMFRRLHSNHALDHALKLAGEHKKPLVVYEGLKLNYPWANARHHTFILQGMRDNARAAQKLGLAYWPFVETPDDPGRGLVARLSKDAVCVVTDDYPAYIVPAHNRALADKIDVPLVLVDGSSVVPLSRLGAPVAAAAHLRPRIHKLFAEAWRHRAKNAPDVPKVARSTLAPPFEPWDATQDIAKFVAGLPIDQSVPAVAGATGGAAAGTAALEAFVSDKLPRYSEERNAPDDPAKSAASALSAYLHYGHISIEQVTQAVLGDSWSEQEINPKTRNKDDFFCRDPNVNDFLDEAITWRDVGYHWHFRRNLECDNRDAELKNVSWSGASSSAVPQFNFETMDFASGGELTLDVVLPEWARASLKKHAGDPREHIYSLGEFEGARTHDPLWNAAQTELICTGRIHNYLRMLWAKKVLEWSATPADAYRTLEHLNNKYALDGRDPNSYTGIHWCFGLFDRPWPPERPVFGSLRYMSSANTAKKFDLDGYYDYVAGISQSAPRR